MRALSLWFAFLPTFAFASTVADLIRQAGDVTGAHVSVELKTDEIDTDLEVLAQQSMTAKYLAQAGSKVFFGTEIGNGFVAKQVIVTLEAAALEGGRLEGETSFWSPASVYVMEPSQEFAPTSGNYKGNCSVYPRARTWGEGGFTIACTFPWLDLGKGEEYLQVMGFFGR